MKALTLMQPWGWAITIAKPIENRSWPPRGLAEGETIAIHAGKSYDQAAHQFPAMLNLIHSAHDDSQPWRTHGAIVGVATFHGAHPVGPGPCLAACMDWGVPSDGDLPMWHWVLAGAPIGDPVPCRGALGLWTVPEIVADAVLRQFPTCGGEGR